MFPPDPRMIEEYNRPSRLPWWSLVIFATGLIAVFLFAIVPGLRLKMYQGAFEDVAEGDSVEEVVKLMGPAREDVPPMHQLEVWFGTKAVAGKEREDLKRVLTWQIHVFHKTVTWQVAFDAKGRAIAKRRYDE